MSPRIRWALLALPVVLAAALSVGACSKPEAAPEPVRAVRTWVVGSGTAASQVEFAAEVKARTESRLGFRVGGKLVARPADLGERVKAGQLLAQIDATDLKLGQDAAQAALQSANSNFEQQATEFKRFSELREQGFISAWELERRNNALQAARAQLDQAKAQAGVQGNQAGYALLTASASGVVTAIEAEPGAVLAAGTPVLRLAHDGPRDAVFSVPEDAALAMRSLLGKAGALVVRPWSADGRAPAMAATVREVAAAADPATRTFAVKADIGHAPLQLGQTLTAVVNRPPQAGVTKLPLTALTQQQGQSAVWLLDTASMTVKAQPVQVAGADGNEVVVTQGLQAGQRVVTAGVHVLTPGQKVKLYVEPGNGGVAAAATVATSAQKAAQ